MINFIKMKRYKDYNFKKPYSKYVHLFCPQKSVVLSMNLDKHLSESTARTIFFLGQRDM